ncbi:MAG: sulfatase-like hydrolase/transferase [Firmicutes bacterium]|nr:sulfatase-like hydrolase/transferase [Bacillota bacterium]
MNRPNIVFFFSDQQRHDTLGCYGQKLDVSPNIDKLAQEGVKFEFAFTCQPVCGPARACLQTGTYATENGCFRNDLALPLNQKTIAHYFNEAGYETAYIGKWHLASDNATKNRGSDTDFMTRPVPEHLRGGYQYWMASDILEFTSHGYDGYVYNSDNERVDFKGYRADCITDFALDYIKDRNGEKPFFLMLSHIEPHHQNDRNRYEGPINSKEKFKNFEVPSDLEGTEGDWRENYPDYLGCCNSLDYNLGRIVDLLKQKGIYDNTVILYTSDHGSHFKTRNAEYKRSCHENSIRIPMIIKGPGFEKGVVRKELASLIDIPPTLLYSGGIDKPPYMSGQPLQEMGSNWPKEVFVQISESAVGRAIRTHKWKYYVSAPDKNAWNDKDSEFYIEEMLFDLENDPVERNNLIHDEKYRDIKKELREILIKRMVSAGEEAPVIQSI